MPVKLTPQLTQALLTAAVSLSRAPFTGRKHEEACADIGTVLVAIHGAPTMWRGQLHPDRPPYPLPGEDPYMETVRQRVAELAPPESVPADPIATAIAALETCADALSPANNEEEQAAWDAACTALAALREPVVIYSPLQAKLIAAVELLNDIHCMARDQGSPQLATEADHAQRILDQYIGYSEGPSDREQGLPEGAPLPWSKPPP